MVLKPKPSTNGILMSPFGFRNTVDVAAHYCMSVISDDVTSGFHCIFSQSCQFGPFMVVKPFWMSVPWVPSKVPTGICGYVYFFVRRNLSPRLPQQDRERLIPHNNICPALNCLRSRLKLFLLPFFLFLRKKFLSLHHTPSFSLPCKETLDNVRRNFLTIIPF